MDQDTICDKRSIVEKLSGSSLLLRSMTQSQIDSRTSSSEFSEGFNNFDLEPIMTDDFSNNSDTEKITKIQQNFLKKKGVDLKVALALHYKTTRIVFEESSRKNNVLDSEHVNADYIHSFPLITFADGSNTFSLAVEPILVHNVYVSCVPDSCRVFLQSRKSPIFKDLHRLETDLLKKFSSTPSKPLDRPITRGSIYGVLSDYNWFRCQVVDYCTQEDACHIMFMDHGGYTTVPSSHLRQLPNRFLDLPFQGIEVYLYNVYPSYGVEPKTDIAAEILFHGPISVHLLGHAEDGIPMVQAYYYDGGYVNQFCQMTIDACLVAPSWFVPSMSVSSIMK